jgi:hypothetical protein
MSVTIFLDLETCRTGMLGGSESAADVREMSVTDVILDLDTCRTGMPVTIFLALEACRTGMLGGSESATNLREKSVSAVILLLDSCRTGMLGGFPEIATSKVVTSYFILEEEAEACRTGMADGLSRSRSSAGVCISSAWPFIRVVNLCICF